MDENEDRAELDEFDTDIKVISFITSHFFQVIKRYFTFSHYLRRRSLLNLIQTLPHVQSSRGKEIFHIISLLKEEITS